MVRASPPLRSRLVTPPPDTALLSVSSTLGFCGRLKSDALFLILRQRAETPRRLVVSSVVSFHLQTKDSPRALLWVLLKVIAASFGCLSQLFPFSSDAPPSSNTRESLSTRACGVQTLEQEGPAARAVSVASWGDGLSLREQGGETCLFPRAPPEVAKTLASVEDARSEDWKSLVRVEAPPASKLEVSSFPTQTTREESDEGAPLRSSLSASLRLGRGLQVQPADGTRLVCSSSASLPPPPLLSQHSNSAAATERLPPSLSQRPPRETRLVAPSASCEAGAPQRVWSGDEKTRGDERPPRSKAESGRLTLRWVSVCQSTSIGCQSPSSRDWLLRVWIWVSFLWSEWLSLSGDWVLQRSGVSPGKERRGV